MRNYQMHKVDSSVLVAQSEPFFCETLSALLEREGYNVVGRASTLDEMTRQIRNKKPECIILETEIANNGDINAFVNEVRSNHKNPKFVLYFNNTDHKKITQALAANLNGYLHSTDRLEELYQCLTHLRTNEQYFSKGFENLLKETGLNKLDEAARAKVNLLTNRERQVLYHFAGGSTIGDMADDFGVSYRTIVNHKRNIILKLDIKNKQLYKFGQYVKPHLNFVD